MRGCVACHGRVEPNKSCFACGRHGELRPELLAPVYPAAVALDQLLASYDFSSAPVRSTDRSVPG